MPTQHRSEPGAAGNGVVFDTQRFSVHDGPGIRTTVFLKGCPLRCLWCHNPESQRIRPELSFERELCILCGNCVEVCPEGAQAAGEGKRLINRELCISCGACVESCYTNALVLKGTTMTAQDVLEEVMRDELLYKKSGGGLTLSGGEPVMQPAFAEDILKGAKSHGIHTAIETCGTVRREILEEILEATDLVIYDLKHMDTKAHERLTGMGNERVLANLERLAALDKETLIRIPLIPGCNDDDDNLRATADSIKRLGIAEVEIIPYHDFASAKYELIDLEYDLKNIKPYTSEQLAPRKRVIEECGVTVRVGV